MANYSPEFIAAMRHDYEHTDKSLARIAADHGVSERTVNRMRDREGWVRRSERVRDLPPAVQALQEATKLLVAQGGAACLPPPERGRSDRHERVHARLPRAMAIRVGVSDDADMRPPPQPSPFQGEGADRPSCTTIERIERLVERELEAEEAARKSLGPLPRPPADAERCARTLATLTQTLHALARLRSGLLPDNGPSDDDTPRDIDEFRRELARRIRLFVQSRTGERMGERAAAHGDAAGEP